MSLGGAMNTAVSALNAQSQQLAMISENLANASTVGYKTVTGSFATLLSGQSTSKYSSGGVTVYTKQAVIDQGQIQSSTTTTNMAIDGNGMFCVTKGTDDSTMYFTRNGEFDTNDDGYLTLNDKYYLMGYRTDADGNQLDADGAIVSPPDYSNSTYLQYINLSNNGVSTNAEATTIYSLSQNLPSDSDTSGTGAVFTSSLAVYDAQGNAQTITATWTHTGTNTWSLNLSADGTGNSLTLSDGSTAADYTVTFDSDGALVSFTDASGNTVDSGDALDCQVTWGDSGYTGSISFNFDLTQESSGLSTPAITKNSASQNGYAFGSLTGVSIGTDGTVTASYDNGNSRPIFKIPLATFANYNGLSATSDNLYQVSATSGNPTLVEAGTEGSGSIDGSSLEASCTDTANEMMLMIIAQQAYSAASQIISTSKTMYDDLINAAR